MAGARRAASGEAGPAGGGQAIVWRNVVLMGLLHLGAVYALSLVPRAQLLTLLWGECGAGGGMRHRWGGGRGPRRGPRWTRGSPAGPAVRELSHSLFSMCLSITS